MAPVCGVSLIGILWDMVARTRSQGGYSGTSDDSDVTTDRPFNAYLTGLYGLICLLTQLRICQISLPDCSIVETRIRAIIDYIFMYIFTSLML